MSAPRPFETDPFHPPSSVHILLSYQFLYIYKTVPVLFCMWYLHHVLVRFITHALFQSFFFFKVQSTFAIILCSRHEFKKRYCEPLEYGFLLKNRHRFPSANSDQVLCDAYNLVTLVTVRLGSQSDIFFFTSFLRAKVRFQSTRHRFMNFQVFKRAKKVLQLTLLKFLDFFQIYFLFFSQSRHNKLQKAKNKVSLHLANDPRI